MRTGCIITSVLAVLMLSVTAPAKEYTSKAGFSLTLPDDWRVDNVSEPPPLGPSPLGLGPRSETEFMAHAPRNPSNVIAGIVVGTGEATLYQYFRNKVAELSRLNLADDKMRLRLDTGQTISVGGREAFSARCDIEEVGDKPGWVRTVLIPYRDKTVVLYLISDDTGTAANSKFEKILASMTFADDKGYDWMTIVCVVVLIGCVGTAAIILLSTKRKPASPARIWTNNVVPTAQDRLAPPLPFVADLTDAPRPASGNQPPPLPPKGP